MRAAKEPRNSCRIKIVVGRIKGRPTVQKAPGFNRAVRNINHSLIQLDQYCMQHPKCIARFWTSQVAQMRRHGRKSIHASSAPNRPHKRICNGSHIYHPLCFVFACKESVSCKYLVKQESVVRNRYPPAQPFLFSFFFFFKKKESKKRKGKDTIYIRRMNTCKWKIAMVRQH